MKVLVATDSVFSETKKDAVESAFENLLKRDRFDNGKEVSFIKLKYRAGKLLKSDTLTGETRESLIDI